MSSPVAGAYRDLLGTIDAWFASRSAALPGVVPCRAGCSRCCHGPFDISVADALLLRDAFHRLSPSMQAAVRGRAEGQVAKLQKMEPGWSGTSLDGISEGRFDELAEALAEEPCPLLSEDGACLVYQDRPLICRMIGLGMVTPAGRVIENACPIAEEFPDYLVLPPQPFDLDTLEDLEVACLEAASVELFGTPTHSGFETTIAAVIVRRET